MKKHLDRFTTLLIFGIFISQNIWAQGNDCINTVMVYLSPTEVEGMQEELHPAIKKALKNYLISEQQRYKFKLVSSLDEADVILDLTYALKNRGMRNQTTSIDLLLKDKYGLANEASVSHQFSLDPEEWAAGENTLDHSEGKFIELLQRTDLLSTIFTYGKQGAEYQHLANPDMIVVLEPIKTEDTAFDNYSPCIESELLSGMKYYARALNRSVNIGALANEPPAVTGAERVVLTLEVKDKGAYYEVVVVHEDKIMMDLSLDKQILSKGLYNPFILSDLYGAGLFLSDPASFD